MWSKSLVRVASSWRELWKGVSGSKAWQCLSQSCAGTTAWRVPRLLCGGTAQCEEHVHTWSQMGPFVVLLGMWPSDYYFVDKETEAQRREDTQ